VAALEPEHEMNDPLTQNRYQTIEQRVVYNNKGALVQASPAETKANMAALLTSLTNHVNALCAETAEKPAFTIHVVCHGAGLDLFSIAQEDDVLKQRFDDLCVQGVRFLACANTLRGRNLKPADLYGVTDQDVVPSGVAELGYLQMQGFAYIHL
jgi:intracellular sulfur oxidation DsrE/DsrF family protein